MNKKQRVHIWSHYAQGGQLCCAQGLVFLKKVLPAKEAKAFNAWAYEELTCNFELDTSYRDLLRIKLLRKLIES